MNSDYFCLQAVDEEELVVEKITLFLDLLVAYRVSIQFCFSVSFPLYTNQEEYVVCLSFVYILVNNFSSMWRWCS